MGLTAFLAAAFIASALINFFQFRTIWQLETEIASILFEVGRRRKPTRLQPRPMLPQNGRWN